MGLGPLQVRSGLNQPLVAEIPIVSATPSEIEQLNVRLASPEAFARVGMDLSAELSANLQFSIGKSASGQPVIKVTTPERFSEPFLSFLLEANWGQGTVTREYTALIDPPFIAPAVIQPMVTPSVAAAPAPAPPPVAPPVASVPEPEPNPRSRRLRRLQSRSRSRSLRLLRRLRSRPSQPSRHPRHSRGRNPRHPGPRQPKRPGPRRPSRQLVHRLPRRPRPPRRARLARSPRARPCGESPIPFVRTRASRSTR